MGLAEGTVLASNRRKDPEGPDWGSWDNLVGRRLIWGTERHNHFVSRIPEGGETLALEGTSSEMRARDRSIGFWLTRIATGQLRMPRFQRFEAWGYMQVKDLLQTVLDGLPAGATLLLEIGDKPPFKYRPLESAPAGPDKVNELLLDGQQRLTALWRALTDSYEEGTYFVSLEERAEETGGAAVVYQKRWSHEGQRRPNWVDNPRQTLQRKLLPMGLLRPGDEGEAAFERWLDEATEGDQGAQLRLYKFVAELRQRVATFNLPYLFLPSATTRPVILDVFVKMNTRAVPLTPFDIIVANVEGETGASLHDLVASFRGKVPSIARYREPSDLVLDVAALLQDRVPNKTGYFGIDWPSAIRQWDQLVVGAERAVALLEQERVLDGTRLPTVPALAPLVALLSHLPSHPDARGNAYRLLRAYLWRSFFTDRYERSSATGAHQDFRELLTPIQQGATSAKAPIFELPLPEPDVLVSA